MNWDDGPIYDSEPELETEILEQLNINEEEDVLGYLIDDEEYEEDKNLEVQKFEIEPKKTLPEIINRKITVENIREESDNMIIACM